MTAHRFTKSGEDYACGAQTLVRSRIAEHWQDTGGPPMQLLIHEPLARQLFPRASPWFIGAGHLGTFEGCPFIVCACGKYLAEDQLIGIDGKREPL